MPPYQSHTLRSHAFEQRHCIMAYFVTHSLQFRDGVEEGRKLNEEQLIQRNTMWAIAGRALLVNCHKHYIGRDAIQFSEEYRNFRKGTQKPIPSARFRNNACLSLTLTCIDEWDRFLKRKTMMYSSMDPR